MGKLLEGKVAIVTGSGQGVGFEIAKALANEGASVITNNRKPVYSLISFEESSLVLTEDETKKLKDVSGNAKTAADFINASGGKAAPFFGDISDRDAARACVKAAIDNFGRIDILVNNAVATWVGSVEKMTPKEWHFLIDSKLNGAFYMVEAALPYMLKQKYGRIINAASDSWLGLQGMSAYSAACAGIWAFTRAIAQDLEGAGITVNSYTPQARTRSWYSMLATYRSQGIAVEDIEEGAPDAMRYTADIFAPFFAYLASDHAAGITGYQFKTAADGQIGIWSNPEIQNDIWAKLGEAWTMKELIAQVPGMIAGISTQKTSVDLH
jgi:3-oxoacyl-[acyl-carrier protein] reductase